MFECYVCGCNEYCQELTNEIFTLEGKPVLVEQIPAKVCSRCGEVTFSRETTEKVRQMLHGEAKPVKSIQMDVFAFG